MTVPMKDGKVAWPKGIGSKAEKLQWLEIEYAKRVDDIIALHAAILAIEEICQPEVRQPVLVAIEAIRKAADTFVKGK